MAITLYPNGKIEGINNANFHSSLSSGHIIQTVTSLIGSSSTGGFGISSSDINNPTFLDADCKISITPQFSNSKILLTWTAGIRIDPSSNGFFGVFYSPNSNMSSSTVVDLKKGSSLDETYRVNNSGSAHQFYSWSRTTYDLTVSNTNIRYYNVGAYVGSGGMQYGDNQVALYLIAQEIKA
tara:strand:+ start:19 stop:561 length:543 start_codon:yes stop_codon:yes gene_type:complete